MSLFDLLDDNSAEDDSKSPEAFVPIETDAITEPETVSALTNRLKSFLEKRFEKVWLVGEITNFSRSRPGHCYLTLKDENAQIPAVIWKSTASRLKFDLSDGLSVVCRGRLSLYPPQGKYQLVIENLQPQGIGEQELALRQLQDRLAAKGWFDPRHKRPLPKIVRRIAVVTSPTGAAIRDFLQVLGRRTRRIDLLIVPVPVQGEGAALEIARAMNMLNRLNENGNREKSSANSWKNLDVIVLTRGGGSTEDLWAFNEEPLVKAVFESKIPVVSAVGHEIDVSLCDLAADVRALTPSEAAERVAREDAELERFLSLRSMEMHKRMQNRLDTALIRLTGLENQTVFQKPERLIENRITSVDVLENRLDTAMDHHRETQLRRMETLAVSLDTLSPLAILARGYSLTFSTDGKRIRRLDDLHLGDTIRTRIEDGELESHVTRLIPLHETEALP